MIEKIDSNPIQDILEKTASRPNDPTKAAPTNDTEVSLNVDYASLIEIAQKIPETNAAAVEQAKQLLLSGQLDSPENIRAAAENIANFGI